MYNISTSKKAAQCVLLSEDHDQLIGRDFIGKCMELRGYKEAYQLYCKVHRIQVTVVPLLKDPSHKRPPPVTDHYYLAWMHLPYIL